MTLVSLHGRSMNRRLDKSRELFDRFDMVYVVNRPCDFERKANIEHELSSLCKHYVLFEATDGWKDHVPMIINEKNKNWDGWTKGAAGLVDTTIRILEDAKKNAYQSILILEDDIIINTMISQAVDDFKRVPQNWELFHFTSTDYKRPLRIGKLKKLTGAWSCQMYAINSSIYDEYIRQLKEFDKPIDVITSEYFHPRGKSFALRYNVVNTVPNQSSIRNKFVNYR